MRNIFNISLILTLSLNLGYAQSIKRSVINSFGSSSSNGTIYLSETFGQPSNIGTVSDGNSFIRQGFEQPVNNLISIPGCTDPNANNFNPFANIDNETCLYSSHIFGDSLTQFGNDVIKTNDQNFLIAGYNDNGENRDGFLAKINFNNEILWSKNIGGYNSDQFNSIIDDNGYYYMCGSTRSFSSDTVRDVFVVKTDYDGNIIWSKVFGGEGCAGPYCGDAGVKIIKESENQYVVVGNAASVGNNLIDAYIFKFDNNGELLYENTSDSGNGSNFYKCISKSSDGGLLIGGQNKAGTSWEPWLKKVDSNGNLIFTNTYGDASTIGNAAADLLEKNDSSFLLISNADGTDGLIKIDAFGDTIFSKQFTGIGCIEISFSLDSNSIYILGNYQSNINYLLKIDLEGNLIESSFFENLNSKKIITVENDLFVLSNPTFNTNGLSDISIFKIDSNFNNCFSVDVNNFNYQDYEVQITNKNDFYTDNNSQNSIVVSENVSNSLNSCVSCIKSDFEYLVNNETIELTNYSTPNISYVWKINDDIFSNEYNPSYEFNLNGIFDICLTSFDSCSSVTYCQTIDLNNCEFSDTSFTEITACESYEWNGQTYTESGEYFNTYTNLNGCDSTHTLYLIINQPDTSYNEVTACESYEWNGTSYTESGVYTNTSTNSNGCDSLLILNLTIHLTDTSFTDVTACDSYDWNGQTFDESGTYFHSIVLNSEYSMNFNGNNNYVSTANDIFNNLQIENGSVSCNINVFDTLSDHSIFSLEGYVEIAIRENNSTIAGDCISQSVILAVSDGTGICNSSDNVVSYPMNNINLNHWVNITITWENTNFIKMYINGLLVDTKTPINSPNIDALNRPITFGIHSSFLQNNYLNGLINNVHLWDVPLSSEQIQNYISCPPKGSEANLLGLWNFEEGEGNIVYDLSVNENDGIIHGATYSTDVPDQACDLTTINGCDSVAVLNLTISQPDTSFTNITACESYEWNGETYTESGTYTQSVSLNNEFSISFDGIDDYVDYGDILNSIDVPITFMFDVKFDFFGTSIFCTDSDLNLLNDNYFGFWLLADSTSISCAWGDGGFAGGHRRTGNSFVDLSLDNWYNVAVSINGPEDFQIYLDGIALAMDYTDSGNGGSVEHNSFPFTLGVAGVGNNPADFFKGNLDNLQIWDNVLSEQDIQTFMSCPPLGNESGLVGYWNFEEGSGTTAYDQTINGNNGTITGATFDTNVPDQSCELTNVNGCDSVAVLNLTISQPDTSITEVTACESYEWNGETYTESGTYTQSISSNNEFSMSFDGIDDYIDLNSLQNQFTSSNGFTFCTWFKSNWIEGGNDWENMIFSITDTEDEENILRVGITYSGDIMCQFNTSSSPGPLGLAGGVVSGNNYNDNQWHYMSIVRSPGVNQTNLDLYIDTTLIFSTSSYIDFSIAYYYLIGAEVDNDLKGDFFNGFLDQTHIWGTALSQQEIQNYMNCPPIGNEDGLVGYWNFEEGEGNTVLDLSNNGNDGIINGATYSTDTPEYSCQLTNINGCDSVAILNLTIHQPDTSITQITACDEFVWEGSVYTESGIYTNTYTNANGCDSTNTLDLMILNSSSGTETQVHCNEFTWIDGITYTESTNSATYILTNSVGCDSVVVLNLSINQSDTSITNVTACENYTWNGVTYTDSGVYTYTSIDSNGCESISILQLNIANFSLGDDIISCEESIILDAGNGYNSYLWSNGDTTQSITVNESDNYSVEVNSDIVYETICGYTETQINETSYWQFVDITIPLGYSVHSIYAGFERVEFINEAESQDFIVDFYQNYDSELNQWSNFYSLWNYSEINYSLYNSELILSENSIYSIDGPGMMRVSAPIVEILGDSWNDFCVTFISEVNCYDDIYVSLYIADTSFTEITACESYEWNGQTYTESGEYTNTYTNVNSCDSVAVLNLTITQPDTSYAEITACDSYEWNGETYTESGEYSNTYTNVNSCDSVAVLNLTITQPDTSFTEITACESYEWNGQTYTESGVYTNTYININGCDSIHTLNLTLNSSTVNIDTQIHCNDYTWIDGVTYNESNNSATYLLTDQYGCDSIVSLDLIISYSGGSIFVNACDSYEWNGETYTESGTYINSYLSNNGCISNDTLQLNIDICGCTDEEADNYDPNATFEDGSCIYCNSFSVLLIGVNDVSEIGGSDGQIHAGGQGGSSNYNYNLYNSDGIPQNPFTLSAGTYTVEIIDYETFCIAYLDVEVNEPTLNFECSADGCIESSESENSFTSLEECELECSFIDPCDITPIGLYVDNIIHNRIRFNWSQPEVSPSHYMIRYREVGTNNWTVIAAGPQTPSPFNGTSRTRYFMEPETTYEWNIRARVLNEDLTINCQSDWSETSTYTTLPACANLENLSVSTEATWVTFFADAPDESWGVWQSKGKIREVGLNNYRYVNGDNSGNINGLKGNFTANTDYEWHTKAWCTGNVDVSGNSDPQYHSGWGEFSAFTTEELCDKLPINLSTSTNGANTSVIMSWDSPISGNPDHYFLEMTNNTSGAVYQWNNIPGADNSKTKFNQSPGDEISWRIRGACGTNGTSWATIFTQPIVYTLGGEKLQSLSLNSLEIYPNPSRDVFNIELSTEKTQQIEIRVVNSIGQEIHRERVEVENMYTEQIDLSDYSKGIYNLTIKTSDGISNHKLILQ